MPAVNGATSAKIQLHKHLLDDARACERPLLLHALRTRQVAEAGNRSPLLKPLLERCLSLHAEDRPSSAEALRTLESLRADPCAYRPAGHGAGVLADRWFKVRELTTLRCFVAHGHLSLGTINEGFRRLAG